ncbi:MAG: hypothetical protein IKU17_10255 [Clostridia bacterium]|nr:hypothetical protein [Clostridia bacterium]
MTSIDKIRTKFQELLWGGVLSQNAYRAEKNSASAAVLLETLVPGEGPGTLCWEDIDYTDQTRSAWQAAQHYVRILKILKDSGKESLNDADFKEKVISAVKYWLYKDFHNPNWWHNDIGMPANLADITFLLYDVLDEATMEQLCEFIGRGTMGRLPDIEARWTGANLIWGAMNTLKHAVLTNDSAWVQKAVERAGQEICIGEAEGLQNDGSFFQHGPRLYSGGYGRSYAYDVAQLAFVLQGTEYQYSEEKLNIFLVHILDGLRHMSQHDSLDWNVIGREMARLKAMKAGILKAAVELCTKNADMPRQEELQGYLACMNGAAQPDATKYFPTAALLCHHTNGIYVGAKFHNDKIWDAEICNSEAELNYNMSYGTHTCIMRDGEEYVDISTVWDYARIPGTTSRTENDEQLLAHRDWWCLPLPSAHYGGMQEGSRAVIYELAQHDGVNAYVSGFAFEGGYVAMGTGIEIVDGRKEALVTTVDQCLQRGEVAVEGDSVVHNGIRYTGLAETKIDVEAKEQIGSWQRNNFAEPDTQISENVVTLTVTHPENKISQYAYLISAADQPAPKVTVLCNDCEVQAIGLEDGTVMAVFHHDCALVFKNKVISGKTGPFIGK